MWGLGEKVRLLSGAGQTEPLQRCPPKQTEKDWGLSPPHPSPVSLANTQTPAGKGT